MRFTEWTAIKSTYSAANRDGNTKILIWHSFVPSTAIWDWWTWALVRWLLSALASNTHMMTPWYGTALCVLLAICDGNPIITRGFPAQRVSNVFSPNKLLGAYMWLWYLVYKSGLVVYLVYKYGSHEIWTFKLNKFVREGQGQSTTPKFGGSSLVWW